MTIVFTIALINDLIELGQVYSRGRIEPTTFTPSFSHHSPVTFRTDSIIFGTLWNTYLVKSPIKGFFRAIKERVFQGVPNGFVKPFSFLSVPTIKAEFMAQTADGGAGVFYCTWLLVTV
jgi:hypothetical protein